MCLGGGRLCNPHTPEEMATSTSAARPAPWATAAAPGATGAPKPSFAELMAQDNHDADLELARLLQAEYDGEAAMLRAQGSGDAAGSEVRPTARPDPAHETDPMPGGDARSAGDPGAVVENRGRDGADGSPGGAAARTETDAELALRLQAEWGSEEQPLEQPAARPKISEQGAAVGSTEATPAEPAGSSELTDLELARLLQAEYDDEAAMLRAQDETRINRNSGKIRVKHHFYEPPRPERWVEPADGASDDDRDQVLRVDFETRPAGLQCFARTHTFVFARAHAMVTMRTARRPEALR